MERLQHFEASKSKIPQLTRANFSARWLGRLEYEKALAMQLNLREQVRETGIGVILGLEHPDVITLGVRGKEADILHRGDTPVVNTSRGGQATFHNPGQLVIYPICPIQAWGIGVRDWVDLLMKATQKTLKKCNIIVINQNNGLHTKNGKIASVGINIKKGISAHGIAVNISNNLAGFELIKACGIDRQPMDRVENFFNITTNVFFEAWCADFEALLKAKTEGFLTQPLGNSSF